RRKAREQGAERWPVWRRARRRRAGKRNDRKWALHRTAATKPGDFRRTTAWNVRIATIVHDPWMDPRRLRGRTFRHDLQRASWKVRGRTVRPHVPWKMDFVIAKGSARDDRDTAVLIKSKHSQV
ncbi:hypothetical protein X777_05249, partial [Ooceraea biroi]